VLRDKHYSEGDPVVYAMSKTSRRPGSRARSIHPSGRGDDYRYVVDKYWRVARVLREDSLLLTTRRGKVREVSTGDPLLRPARWWEKLLRRSRFPDAQTVIQAATRSAAATGQNTE
jgi:transposase InsO family protein